MATFFGYLLIIYISLRIWSGLGFGYMIAFIFICLIINSNNKNNKNKKSNSQSELQKPNIKTGNEYNNKEEDIKSFNNLTEKEIERNSISTRSTFNLNDDNRAFESNQKENDYAVELLTQRTENSYDSFFLDLSSEKETKNNNIYSHSDFSLNNDNKSFDFNQKENDYAVELLTQKTENSYDSFYLDLSNKDKMQEENKTVHYELIDRENTCLEYCYPSLELLNKPTRITKEEQDSIEKMGDTIVDMCERASIPCKLIDITISEPLIMFKINLKRKGDYGRFFEGKSNFKLFLRANRIFISQIDEANNVNIIITIKKDDLSLYSCIKEFKENERVNGLLYCIGEDYDCNKVFGDLSINRNLLIGGYESSGKTNLINAIIMSFIYNYSPYKVQLAIITSNYGDYEELPKLPHCFNCPIRTSDIFSSKFLRSINKIKNDRIDFLRKNGYKSFYEYNTNCQNEEKAPSLVIVIDSLEELLLSDKQNIDTLKEITANGYAAGIHIIAVVESANKSNVRDDLARNFNGRITFLTATAAQSRSIIGELGAEKMSYQGEVMYKQTELSEINSAIIPRVEPDEIKRVCDYLSHQLFDDLLINSYRVTTNVYRDSFEEDSLYDLAKEYVLSVKRASVHLLQNRFSISTSRAETLISQLEKNKVITKGTTHQERKVYKPINKMV